MWISYVLAGIFGICVIAHLIGEFLIVQNYGSDKKIRYITKPLLIPLLTGFYLITILNINWFIFSALILGWIGDLMLMIPPKDAYANSTGIFFKIGLIAFLLGHICYIVGFMTSIVAFTNIPWWIVIIMIQVIIYGLGIYRILIPFAGKMKNSITIYIVVIILMEMASSCLFGSGETLGVIVVMLGATLFMISDTINAFNRFKKPIPYERIYTMSTYLLGQFLIILGLVLAFN